MSRVSEEGFYEIGHLVFSLDHPIVPLAQDIRLKRKKELQGASVVLSIGKETGVEGSVDILPKKDL